MGSLTFFDTSLLDEAIRLKQLFIGNLRPQTDTCILLQLRLGMKRRPVIRTLTLRALNHCITQELLEKNCAYITEGT